jgi:hypothetical protein
LQKVSQLSKVLAKLGFSSEIMVFYIRYIYIYIYIYIVYD